MDQPPRIWDPIRVHCAIWIGIAILHALFDKYEMPRTIKTLLCSSSMSFFSVLWGTRLRWQFWISGGSIFMWLTGRRENFWQSENIDEYSGDPFVTYISFLRAKNTHYVALISLPVDNAFAKHYLSLLLCTMMCPEFMLICCLVPFFQITLEITFLFLLFIIYVRYCTLENELISLHLGFAMIWCFSKQSNIFSPLTL